MLDPDIGQVIGHLERGQGAAAVRLARSFVASDPADATAVQLLGVCTASVGDRAVAVVWFARVSVLLPQSPVPLAALAAAVFDLGRQGQGRKALHRAQALAPADATQLVLLAGASAPGPAESLLRRALAIEPENAAASANLGVILRRRGALGEAARVARVASSRNPALPELLSNLAILAIKRRELDNAAKWAGRVLAVRPDFAEGIWNRAFIHLLAGRFEEGWTDAEARWRVPGAAPERHPSSRRWHGENIAGKTLLLHAEQGLGDTIQFCRYVPMAAARGASVILAVQPGLRRLVQSLAGVTAVVAGDGVGLTYDFHCPLMSLPQIFTTTIASIPAMVPYLSPPTEIASPLSWLPTDPAYFRVGLSWQGNPANHDDVERSLTTSQLAPLIDIPGITFVALRRDGEPLPVDWPVIDERMHPGDMADTAAVVRALDLVIACDSAVAHLAGALGRPTWTLLSFAGDWRWMLDRDTTPWYPTMRLFRQQRFGDWNSVIAAVASSLRQRLAEKIARDPRS